MPTLFTTVLTSPQSPDLITSTFHYPTPQKTTTMKFLAPLLFITLTTAVLLSDETPAYIESLNSTSDLTAYLNPSLLTPVAASLLLSDLDIPSDLYENATYILPPPPNDRAGPFTFIFCETTTGSPYYKYVIKAAQHLSGSGGGCLQRQHVCTNLANYKHAHLDICGTS
jgi:hypothetical protein